MIEFLSGALAFAYLSAGMHFLRFWRRTSDPLFGYFAVAFCLFSLNQVASTIPVVASETGGYEYLLRAAGFTLILVAIAHKNVTKPPS